MLDVDGVPEDRVKLLTFTAVWLAKYQKIRRHTAEGQSAHVRA